MKMKKILALGIAAALCVCCFGGCANNKEDESVLKFYHGYYQDEAVWAPAKAMRDIYKEFQLMHIDDEVTFEPIALTSDGAVEDMMRNEVAGGNFPEMIDLAGVAIPANAMAQDVVYDLKPALDADPEFKEAVGINYEQNLENGKIYTIHDQLLVRGLWYNADLFESYDVKLPQDTANSDEFSTEMDKFRDGTLTAAYQPFNTMQLWAELGLTDSGIKLMTSPLTAEIVNSAAFDEFERAFKSVANELRKNESKNYLHNLDNFLNGTVPVYIQGVWGAGSFTEGKPAFEDIRPGLYPGNVVLVSAGGGLSISNQISDAKKELAVEFIKYMVSEEVQAKIFKAVQAMPCNPNVDFDAACEGVTDPAVLYLRDACKLARADTTREVPGGVKWGADIERAINDALTGCMNENYIIDDQWTELKTTILGLLG